MKISKNQLRRIIREEYYRVQEQVELKINNGGFDHHFPTIDFAEISEAATTAWVDQEISSFDRLDPSMMGNAETVEVAKENWGKQVEAAANDLVVALEENMRRAALEVFTEVTQRLIDGEFGGQS